MLIEPDVIVPDEPSSPEVVGSRLAKLVARLPGLRLLPSLQGEPALIAIDEHEGPPVWLGVADPALQLAVLQDGAAGVVGLNVDREALAAAVEALRQGHAVVPQALLQSLLADDVREPLMARPDGPSLTPREDSVLSLLSEGATNKMIARRLDISVHTAKFHVASILDKLDATTRTDAVAQGVRQGLLML